MTSGAVVSEVALSTSAWFVEHLSRRFTTRTQLVVIAVVAALTWLVLLLRLTRSAVPGRLLAVGTVIAPVLGSYVFFDFGDARALQNVQWVYLAIAVFVFVLALVFFLSTNILPLLPQLVVCNFSSNGWTSYLSVHPACPISVLT